MRMVNNDYIGRAEKLSSAGGKTSLWTLRVIRVSTGVIVAESRVQLPNNEFTVDRAIAKARRKAAAFRA